MLNLDITRDITLNKWFNITKFYTKNVIVFTEVFTNNLLTNLIN